MTTFEKFRKILVDLFGVEDKKITMDTHLVNDLAADSLDLTEIYMRTTSEFKIDIPDEKFENLRTVAQIVRYIESKQKSTRVPVAEKTQQKPVIQPKKTDWDEVFLVMAYALASGSHCVSHQVGCLLVKDKRIISTGINGTPEGCQNCDEIFPQKPKDGTDTGFDRAKHHEFSLANEIHAEMNALLYTAKNGGAYNLHGATLYCTTQPCSDCLKNIMQSGVSRIVYAEKYDFANYSDFIKSAVQTKKIEMVHKPISLKSQCLNFIKERIH